MADKAKPMLPVLYSLHIDNLGSDCSTTVTVDSTGAVFSTTISWYTVSPTFEKEIADVQKQAAALHKKIEALRAIQRKVKERLSNGQNGT